MKDVLPFYTLDGSVGLYNKHDEDIYHSVYGAFSEAYDKFILPAHFEDFFRKNSEIKILDICYGIGYNTKSFLNYFLENFCQKKIKKSNTLTGNIEPIDTDNPQCKKYNEQIHGDNTLNSKCNDEIHSYNVLTRISENYSQNDSLNQDEKINQEKNGNFSFFNNNKQDFNNINRSNLEKTHDQPFINGYKIQIEAIDMSETLMKVSPLFDSKKFVSKNQKTNINVVDKYLSKKTPNNHKYKLKDEVNMILLINLLNQYQDKYFSDDIKEILGNKTFKPFFSSKMIDFMKFYEKQGCNSSCKESLSTFLHNIYYQYISKSYKNTLKVLENNEISINYITDDARCFVRRSLERYDFMFLDAFTPAKCPALWTVDFFNHLYQILAYDGMILTYSSSSAVRSAMQKANFYVGKIFNSNENKFTGTIAVKNPDLIKFPLDKYEQGLLKTKAGIVFTDKKLSDSNEVIIERRHKEVQESSLLSSSQYIKNFKELSNEI